jgi:hypothetical protein
LLCWIPGSVLLQAGPGTTRCVAPRPLPGRLDGYWFSK